MFEAIIEHLRDKFPKIYISPIVDQRNLGGSQVATINGQSDARDYYLPHMVKLYYDESELTFVMGQYGTPRRITVFDLADPDSVPRIESAIERLIIAGYFDAGHFD